MQAVPIVDRSYTLAAPLEAKRTNMTSLQVDDVLGKYIGLAAAGRSDAGGRPAKQGYIFENGTVHVPSDYTGVWFKEVPTGGRRRRSKKSRGKKSRGKKSSRRQTRRQQSRR
jgi:hypothetical protein